MNESLECSTASSGRKPLKERARFARPQNDMTTGAFVLTLIFVAVLVAPYTDHPVLWLLAPFGLVAAGTAVKALFKPDSAWESRGLVRRGSGLSANEMQCDYVGPIAG